MKYSTRKFIKNLTESDSEKIINDKLELLFDIHNEKILLKYKNILGFDEIDDEDKTIILRFSKYKKGRFLLENGFLDDKNRESVLNDVLCFIEDFGLFKYIVDDCDIVITPQLILKEQTNIRKIKYLFEKLSDTERKSLKINLNIIDLTRSNNNLNKLIFFKENNIFDVNDLEFPLSKGSSFQKNDEVSNYIFGHLNSKNKFKSIHSFFCITEYMIEELFKISPEDTKKIFIKNNDSIFLRKLSDPALLYCYSLGLLDDLKINILSLIKTPKSMKKFILSLNRDSRNNLLNKKDYNNENFLWGGYTKFLSLCKVDDIIFLIKEGLNYLDVNNNGESFIEQQKIINCEVKQFLIDKGIPVKDHNNCIKMIDLYNDKDLNFAKKNNFKISNQDLERHFMHNWFDFKEFKRMVDFSPIQISEIFRHDYILLTNNIFNKKIMSFLIKEFLNNDINRKDSKGAFIVYWYPPEYLDFFIKKGFDITLIPNDSKEYEVFTRENTINFTTELVKVKLKKEKKLINSSIYSLENTSKKKKRI